MGIRSKLLLAIIFIVALPLLFFVDWVLEDLTPQYRESTEEPLVDAAYVLASLAAATADDGTVDIALFREAFADVYSQQFSARIYSFTKQKVDFRVYITDASGTVLFDSFREAAEGEDYSKWRDVRLTMQGLYGARTSRDMPLDPPTSIMYVAAPILVDGDLIGVLSVGKPTTNANSFVASAQRKIAFVALLCAAAALLIGIFVAERIASPIRRLTRYAVEVRDGKRAAIPKVAGAELQELASAFESMRDTLEGKKYVEQYVQTLTHEIKSPLAGIRGSCELLKEDPPAERARQFLKNIESETARIRDIIDKLLLLSKLEAQKQLEERALLRFDELLTEIVESFTPTCRQNEISLTLSVIEPVRCLGDAFLLRQAVSNILQNAVEFSPEGGAIECSLRLEDANAVLTVIDDGPGIPAYAASRVFERFYSLSRPGNGRKSSGLGLSLVQEVASIHGGSIELFNESGRGAKAVLRLPRIS